ncbi:MAG: hypothetical protein VW577_06575, partial [Pelagibacteraceae bacterium]
MNQQKKAKISAALKAVVPAGWKYTLRIYNHSRIDMTITKAPVDLVAAFGGLNILGNVQVNPFHYRSAIRDESVAKVFDGIVGALNTDNYDNSDPMTDFFDVGHYVGINIGEWNRPFQQ